MGTIDWVCQPMRNSASRVSKRGSNEAKVGATGRDPPVPNSKGYIHLSRAGCRRDLNSPATAVPDSAASTATMPAPHD